jgi:hypothetical protein
MNAAHPDPRRYLGLVALLAGALVALAAAINFFVDPFDYFGRNTLGVYIAAARAAKLTGLRQNPRAAVLIGTSKAAMIDVAQLAGPAPFFNASLGGATPEEVVALVKQVSPTAPLVVVALDFFQFGDSVPYQPVPFAPPSWQRDFSYLFSLDGLGYSFTTISRAERGLPPTLLPNGSFNPALWFEHYDHADPAALARLLDDREARWREFHFSPERVAELADLRAALDARHEPYVVLINPLDAADFARVRRAGLGPAYTDWAARVHRVFPDVIDLAVSPYSDPKNFFRLDPVHLYPQVGADMLNRLVLPRAAKETGGSS